MRHSAWLSAALKVDPAAKSAEPSTRLDRLRKERGDPKFEPDMPPMDAGGYLVEYLLEIGPVMQTGMGAAAITHGELLAWQQNTGIVLQPWEARGLRYLSREYVNQLQLAERADCPAPWRAEDQKPVATNTQSALRALANL